ncbi:MAG: response regulator [Anaerolineales bacterium]|jgi:two-component system KDP operon response regulator KdpE
MPGKPPTNKNNPTRVLVIDDDDAMTDMIKHILEPNSFDVMVANSGPEGIRKSRQNNPEVVILDLLMPDMDGWEVCKAIREFSQMPILVISAISKPGMVAKALDEGADDYLLKPVTSNVLIANVRRLARRARAEREATDADLKFLSV